MTNILPRRINARWLQQRQTFLSCTARKLDDGTPNPLYAQTVVEVAEAEAELERWQKFVTWVERSLKARLNMYPLRADGQTFEPGRVFVHKDRTTGKTWHLTVQEAWDKYQESLPS